MITLKNLLDDEKQLDHAERDLSLLLSILDQEEEQAPIFPTLKSVMLNYFKNTYGLRGHRLQLALNLYSLSEIRLDYTRAQQRENERE